MDLGESRPAGAVFPPLGLRIQASALIPVAAELRHPVFSLSGDKTPDPLGLNSVLVIQSAALKVLKAWRARLPPPHL